MESLPVDTHSFSQLSDSLLLTTLGVFAPETRFVCLDDPMDSDQDCIARHELLETIQKMIHMYIFFLLHLSLSLSNCYHRLKVNKIPTSIFFLQERLQIELQGRGGEVQSELLQNLGVKNTERSNDLGLALLTEVDVCASGGEVCGV